MSQVARQSEVVDPATFAATVAAAVEQILAARVQQAATTTPPHFAISPAFSQPNVLDYSSGIGAKIFTKATEALTTPFNIRNPNVKLLLHKLQVRSESFGWNDLFTINVLNSNSTRTAFDLLSTHGQCSMQHAACSMQHVQEESSRYLNEATRKIQNNYPLFVCLTNTVNEHTSCILANNMNIYTQSGTPCGITYLKLLIQKSEIDTRATASHIQCRLTQFDT
jgi:hypothetical protein